MQPIIPVAYLGASESLKRKGPTMLLRTRRTIVVNRHQRDKLFRDYYPAATPRKIEALHSDFSKKIPNFSNPKLAARKSSLTGGAADVT